MRWIRGAIMSGVASWAWRNRTKIGRTVKGFVGSRGSDAERDEELAARAEAR